MGNNIEDKLIHIFKKQLPSTRLAHIKDRDDLVNDLKNLIITETTKAVQQTWETIMEVAGEYRGEGMLADFVNVDDLGRVSLDRLQKEQKGDKA